MKNLVIDVSAIVPLVFEDEDHRYAEAVVRELAMGGGVVPAIFWFEIWNVITTNEQRRGRIASDDGMVFLYSLERMRLTTALLPRFDKVMGLARTHNLTVYDAAYLELASRLNAPLVTLDKELMKTAGEADVSLFTSA